MRPKPLPRLDQNPAVRSELLRYCRLKPGEIWRDAQGGHAVGCLDAACADDMQRLLARQRAQLAIQDPPYNLVAFAIDDVQSFIEWCRKWVAVTCKHLADDAAFYIWLGADQDAGFQPLPEFMLLMREFSELQSRSWITMRNQRGYGTQKNWMAVRQELLYYTKGKPHFTVQYTDIPKILRGYYKVIDGRRTENLERGKSPNIRPGNVWVDIQQVFYRMEENVAGCYAQKPLAAIARIIAASSQPKDLVLDFFSHAGTTLLAAEIAGRRCYTCDVDPIFCELTIRRLENFRKTGRRGWQNESPFSEAQNYCA